MDFWHRMAARWRNLARKQAVEQDLDAEIRSYQDMLEDEKLRAGMDPAAARRAVLLETGSRTRIKEEVRDVMLGATLEAMWMELRQSAHGLRRNPGLTLLGIGTLALGMGASIIVFSFFHAALIQPLPFRDTDRLVQIWETRQHRGLDKASFTEANFWDVRSRSRSFTEMAACQYSDVNLTGSGPAAKVKSMLVTAGFFRTLGVAPIMGRDFSYEEERAGRERHVVIIGNRFWNSYLHGDPNILGKTLRLNNKAHTVIGILPPGEPWINRELYVPFAYRAGADRGSWEYDVVARLAPGITMENARAELQRIGLQLAEAYPTEDKGIGFRVEPSSRWAASDGARRALSMLLGAVLFLLLIACLNVANLLLARGTARQREIAVRTALGAGRGRLVRFVMMESVLLSICGAAVGLALAYWGIHLIQALEVRGIPRLAEAGLTPGVLAFAVGIALLTGVLAGLAPSLQAPSRAIAAVLRDADRQTGSRGQGRLRAVLITGEVALSFLLLAGAGLLIRSFVELVSIHRGFQTENRLFFSVSLPESYWTQGTGKPFMDRFLERLSAVPEVMSAGAVSHRPVEGGNPGMGIDAREASAQKQPPWSGWRVVTPTYFGAAGLPLLRGRTFDANDLPVWGEPGQPPPARRVLISQQLAKLLFPQGDAVGRHVSLWKGQGNLDAEVIGVVGDSLERGLAAGPALTVYLPYGEGALPTEFVAHTRGNPLAIAGAVRSIVAEIDPDLPVAEMRSFDDVVHRSVALQQFNAVLLAVFGGLALLLATTGIYGVLSYAVSRRTSEIGLRAALGASRATILRMTIGQGLRPALWGVALGLVGAWWLSRYVAALLFGVTPFDALTYVAVTALLLLTAVFACYVPGRRAMRIDPAVALRTE